jgi:two-component system response regulator MprA
MQILLADDDSATLNFVKRALHGDGHDVTIAEDGSAALELLTKNTNQFGLIIADVDMPGLDGIALCEQAVAIKPAMPVLLMSAHHAQLPRAGALAGARYEFLLKPFTLEEIRAAVKRLLD